jgi:hypothetical protein
VWDATARNKQRYVTSTLVQDNPTCATRKAAASKHCYCTHEDWRALLTHYRHERVGGDPCHSEQVDNTASKNMSTQQACPWVSLPLQQNIFLDGLGWEIFLVLVAIDTAWV